MSNHGLMLLAAFALVLIASKVADPLAAMVGVPNALILCFTAGIATETLIRCLRRRFLA